MFLKCFLFALFFINLLFTSLPSQATMSALSNHSLGQIQVDDQKRTVPLETAAPAVRFNEKKSGDPGKMFCKQALSRFRNCATYQKFLHFVGALQQIALQKNYPRVIDSKRFLTFCSRFAATSAQCRRILFSLNLPHPDPAHRTILKMHNELFLQATLFHKVVYRYQTKHAGLPDLNQFLTRFKIGLNTIEAEYAEL